MSAHRVRRTGKPETRKCSRQRQYFEFFCGLARISSLIFTNESGEKGNNLLPPRPVSGQSRKTSSPRLQLGWRWLSSGIRGSALSPSHPDEGGAQFQGRGVQTVDPASRRALGGCSQPLFLFGPRPNQASLVQLLEHRILNPEDPGSSPGRRSIVEYPQVWPWRND